MRKIYLLLILILCLQTAQSKTILGVKEFCPKSEAKKILIDTYGDTKIYDDGNSLIVANPSIGGYRFSLCELLFTQIDGKNLFNGATFQKWFSESELNTAKELRDNLMKSLHKKYGEELYVEFKNSQGFKCCEFGTFEEGSVGTVELSRDNGQDGKERIYLTLYYHPFNNEAINNEL